MNKLIQLFFYLPLVGFVFVLTACDWFTWNTIDISGTVTVKRKGETWYPYLGGESTNSLSRTSPIVPLHDRPQISAFTSPGGRNIGNNYKNYQPISEDDYAQGLYHWTVELTNVARVPDIIYFEVAVSMEGLYPRKMTHGIQVGNNNSAIDLGLIDFDVVRLNGNLQVTLDDEPLQNNPFMYIRRGDGTYFVNWGIEIAPHGNWVQYAYSQDSEVPLTFNLTAEKNRGIFKAVLNPQQIITVYNTDKEISFSEYPTFNFQSCDLSGTIEIPNPETTRYWIEIYFYDDDDYTKEHIGLASSYPPHQTNEEGLIEWKATVPAFSFPQTLFFQVNAPRYKKYSQITITEDMDLRNINLGTFRD